MKSNTLLWLVLGGAAIYFLLKMKGGVSLQTQAGGNLQNRGSANRQNAPSPWSPQVLQTQADTIFGTRSQVGEYVAAGAGLLGLFGSGVKSIFGGAGSTQNASGTNSPRTSGSGSGAPLGTGSYDTFLPDADSGGGGSNSVDTQILSTPDAVSAPTSGTGFDTYDPTDFGGTPSDQIDLANAGWS